MQGIVLRAVFGDKHGLWERSLLTAWLFNRRLARKTLAFSKDLSMHRAAASWQDGYYNLIRPHKSLSLPVEDDPKQRWRQD